MYETVQHQVHHRTFPVQLLTRIGGFCAWAEQAITTALHFLPTDRPDRLRRWILFFGFCNAMLQSRAIVPTKDIVCGSLFKLRLKTQPSNTSSLQLYLYQITVLIASNSIKLMC